MTLHEKYVALRDYYEQTGHSVTDAARMANNALLLIGVDVDIPLNQEFSSIPPCWSDDFQLFFAA